MRPSLLVALAALCLPSLASAAPGYLRYPDLHGDTLVFSAEDDLWVAPAQGGPARRLTTHAGSEYFAKVSPDGQSVAFSGTYDGNQDVYVMPLSGGLPRRLTWHPYGDEVLGWWPDGAKVLFRSKRDCPHGRSYHLYTVGLADGAIEELPLGWAANLSVDPEHGLVALDRIALEHRTWKRYRGGMAQDLWVGPLDMKGFQRVTTFEGADAFPMWHGGRLFFLSDEGGTANLWSMAPDGSDRRQLTQESQWDLRWPSMAPDGRIVAMRAGGLVVYDPASGTVAAPAIDLPSERLLTRERYPDPTGDISWFTLSPDGDRVLLVLRGEVFSVPAEEGVTLPISRGSGARESWATFDPKGERVLYVTDEGGEESIASADAWGRGDVKTLSPAGVSNWHFPPAISPDGRWLAWGDQTYALWVAPVAGGTAKKIDQSEQWEISEYRWSPDGRWLAYTKLDRRSFGSIYLYDTQTAATHRLTGATTQDRNPAWDPEGRYLYFTSDRTINPFLGVRDFDYVLEESTGLYAFLLRKDVENPLIETAGMPPTPGEPAVGGEKKRKRDKKCRKERKCIEEAEGPKPPVSVTIDLEGLTERVIALPVAPGNYGNLAATAETLFYQSWPTAGMTSDLGPDPSGTLMAFGWEEQEATAYLAGVGGYELSLDGKKLVVSTGGGALFVIGTEGTPGEDLSESAVDVSDVVLDLEPVAEWRQIYWESWRLQRDFFWDAALGGLDWKTIGERYASLLPLLGCRDDLRDLIGELIGELANSHTYVWGGDPGREQPWRSVGTLGAEVERAGDAWKVTRVYRGDPADNVRSPLAEPGVEVAEGAFLQAVNHRPFPANEPFEAAFDGLADREVVLTVSDKAQGGHTRDVVITPTGDDHPLRYADWVRRNREYVEARTDGKMGYLHLPNMGTGGLVAFETWFYPQLDKQGLVVDVRWNGGGFVSQLILARLRRTLVGYDRARGGGIDTYPSAVLNGPFVVITNEFAGSDGDIFPMAVQETGIAPVLGARSWGGVVGIRGDKPMVDGGLTTQPEFAFWFPTKGWGLENRGVEPDIPVQNLPQDVAAGRDPQLDRAIEELLKLRAAGHWVPPEFEPAPIKTREAFQERERPR